MKEGLKLPGGRALETKPGGLALGAPQATPGTIHALAMAGGISVSPRDGRTILFGRNRPEVHVCVGEHDRRVSRTQGQLVHRQGVWWVQSTGRLPVRMPRFRLLFVGDEPVPLPDGYTPLFVRGTNGREHLLEVHVMGSQSTPPRSDHDESTLPPRAWQLTPDERLLLVVLGQRYLLHEAYPQPLTWRQVSEQLRELQPHARWTVKQIEHQVKGIRLRLSRGGVPGLTREEIGEPVGNALNHNLIRELMETTTLVPMDLGLLNFPTE